MFTFNTTLFELTPDQVSDPSKAQANAEEFVKEVIDRLKERGRTEQFTTRLTPETYAAIYLLAEQMNARAIAEVIEIAITDLEAKLNR